MDIQLIESALPLTSYLAMWRDLINHAVEPNPFLEPYFLLPAMQHLGADSIYVALVWSERCGSDRQLIGLYPFVRKFRYGALPVSFLSTTAHSHSYLGTPLVRRGHEKQVVRGILNWLATRPLREMFFEMRDCYTEEPFHLALLQELRECGQIFEEIPVQARPYLNVPRDLSCFESETLKPKTLKELRRKRRRAEELGPLRLEILDKRIELTSWCDAFLKMEAEGWKGECKSALLCCEANTAFFRALTDSAFNDDKLYFFRLQINHAPIAMQLCLLSGSTLFSFKIAYDESFARLSPGMLLLEEVVKYAFRSDGKIAAVDSCCDSSDMMMRSILAHPRARTHINLETGRCLSHLVSKSIPHLRSVSRSLCL